MIDLSSEVTFPLADLARYVSPSRGGKRGHLSTYLRWVLTGLKGPGGETVRLDAVRLGGRWVTSLAALQRFTDRLTPRFGDAPETAAPRAGGRRQGAAERADKRLESLGV